MGRDWILHFAVMVFPSSYKRAFDVTFSKEAVRFLVLVQPSFVLLVLA
jgi:hypothetical protein